MKRDVYLVKRSHNECEDLMSCCGDEYLEPSDRQITIDQQIPEWS